MESNPSNTSRNDRKTVERNRRNQMKVLYSQLHSLLPHHSSRDVLSLPDQLELATNHIQKLQINIEKLKKEKDRLLEIEGSLSNNGLINESKPPKLEVHETGFGNLEVILVTGLDNRFVFNEIIRILYEEGAEILNANLSVVDDTVFHTIHSKVDESTTRHGTARVCEKLKKFIILYLL